MFEKWQFSAVIDDNKLIGLNGVHDTLQKILVSTSIVVKIKVVDSKIAKFLIDTFENNIPQLLGPLINFGKFAIDMIHLFSINQILISNNFWYLYDLVLKNLLLSVHWIN